jgi:hypothetical protein
MKALLPFVTLTLILSISVMSSILYLNRSYTSSALLTIAWIVGITYWIGAIGARRKEAK